MTLWCKKVEVKGPTGAKALRQALPCLSRKSQLSEGLEAGGRGGMRAGLRSRALCTARRLAPCGGGKADLWLVGVRG